MVGKECEKSRNENRNTVRGWKGLRALVRGGRIFETHPRERETTRSDIFVVSTI